MKKLLVIALFAVALTTSSFAAGGKKVNFFALTSFKSQFKDASNVSWSEGQGYTKATFVSNSEKMEAFYNASGELIATSRKADLNSLPVKTKRVLATKLEGYTVKEAIRIEGPDERAYYISAQNEKGSVIYKVEDSGFVTEQKI